MKDIISTAREQEISETALTLIENSIECSAFFGRALEITEENLPCFENRCMKTWYYDSDSDLLFQGEHNLRDQKDGFVVAIKPKEFDLAAEEERNQRWKDFCRNIVP